MMGNDVPTPGGLPPGPPWPLDLLADLHAGVLEPELTEELRRRVESDQDAMDALAALDATRRDLASLPAPRIPDDVAARLNAAIAAEAAGAARPAVPAQLSRPAQVPPPPQVPPPAQPAPPASPAPVVDLDAVRRRRRGLIAGGGVLAAAAAVAVVAVVNLLGPTTGGEPQPRAAPLTLTTSELHDAVDDVLGATDYGPLASSGRLDGCLIANDAGGAQPIGARSVILDGKRGILLVLPAGSSTSPSAGSTAPRWRLLVVGPECGPGKPETLADTGTG